MGRVRCDVIMQQHNGLSGLFVANERVHCQRKSQIFLQLKSSLVNHSVAALQGPLSRAVPGAGTWDEAKPQVVDLPSR
jgi:hypothetical protein